MRFRGLLALVVAAAFGLVLVPSAAHADVYPCRRAGGQYRSQCAKVTDVNGSLPMRLGAGYGNTRPGTAYHNGDELALQCWTTGPADEYGNGDTYWFKVFDPNDGNIVGFVNDYNLTTGQPSDWKPHFSHCDDPVSQAGKPYQCDRQGGEYRAWCAKVTYVAEDMWLPLDKRADYAHGAVGGTKYHNGDPLALVCWTTGPADFGGHGDTYWFSVYDPADHAIEGYVNDYDLTTGSPSDWKKVVAKCGGDQPPGQNPPSYPHSVNVLQWNIAGTAVNYGTPIADPSLTKAAVARHPQVITMNEVCASQAKDVGLHLAATTGRKVHYEFQTTAYNPLCLATGSTVSGIEEGNAILSFAPMSHTTKTYFKNGTTKITDERQDRGVLCTTVELKAPVHACVAHLATPDETHGRLPARQAQKFASTHRSWIGEGPTVIAGDFNAKPKNLADFAHAYVAGDKGDIFYEASHRDNSIKTYQNKNKASDKRRLDYIFGNKDYFKRPGAGDGRRLDPGTCHFPWQRPRMCSDHWMYFGSLSYHE